MMRASALFAITFASLALLSSTVSAVNNVMIYTDYSSGLSTLFGQRQFNSFGDAQFNTVTSRYALPAANGQGFQTTTQPLPTNGAITLGFAWAGDIDDQVILGYTQQTSPTIIQLPLVITSFGPYAANCSINGSGTGFQLTVQVPYCNLTISWTRPFSGNLLIGYQNQSSAFGQTEAITVFFINTTSSTTGSAANATIFTDYTTGLSTTLGLLSTNSFSDAQFNTQTRSFALPATNGQGFQSTTSPLPNGTINLGFAWANDPVDQVTFSSPSSGSGGPLLFTAPTYSPITLPLVFTAFGPYAANCSVNSTVTGFQLSAAVPYCNITVSWTRPFTGNLLISYLNQSAAAGQTEAITLFFFNTSSTGTVTGDPQFVGLRGQSYQVHGMDGAVYNLITESNTQVNSRFVFLTEGECPTVDGKVNSVGCWSHPGSYMGELSFQAVVDGKLHAALVTSGDAKKGFASVQMDGKSLKAGETVSFGAFSLTYTNSHSAYITLDNYNIDLSNSDKFLNLALIAKVPLSQLRSHGLIGQTHSTKTYKNTVKYVEGEVDDYIVTDDDVFGTSFPFNKFGAK